MAPSESGKSIWKISHDRPDTISRNRHALGQGAEQAPVEYEITVFEVNMVIRTEGWIEAGLGVLAYAQSSSGAQLRLSDGRVAEVSVGSFNVRSDPTSRAELIVHGGL